MNDKNNNKSNKNQFQPKDLLCVAAALLFVGIWLADREGIQLSLPIVAVVYAGIALLLAIYFVTSDKFKAAWRRWNKHTKIFFIILVLGDVIAWFTYNIPGNTLYLALMIIINFVYYLLFLRDKTQ